MRLDGEFYGQQSASGNGVPGGDFIANVKSIHMAASSHGTWAGHDPWTSAPERSSGEVSDDQERLEPQQDINDEEDHPRHRQGAQENHHSGEVHAPQDFSDTEHGSVERHPVTDVEHCSESRARLRPSGVFGSARRSVAPRPARLCRPSSFRSGRPVHEIVQLGPAGRSWSRRLSMKTAM